MTTASPQGASDEIKIAILEAAFNDAQDNLRFAESKAGFIAVVLTVAVTALPSISSLNSTIGFEALRNSLIIYFVQSNTVKPPFESFLLLSGQTLILVAILMVFSSIILSIRAAIPFADARRYIDLSCGPNDPLCHPGIFYPTGSNRPTTLYDLFIKPRLDLKFSYTALQQRNSLAGITAIELIHTLGEQVIILGFIRDLKMKRVEVSLKFVLTAIILLAIAFLAITVKYMIYGSAI